MVRFPFHQNVVQHRPVSGRRPRHHHAGSRTHQQRRAVQLLQGCRTPSVKLHHLEGKRQAAWAQSVRAARSISTQSAGASPRKDEQKISEERERRHAPVVLVPQADHAQRRGLPNSAPQDPRRSALCATHFYCSVVLSARDHPLGCDPGRPCNSFTAAEVPTEEERCWPFGPKYEPVAVFGHSASGNVLTDTRGIYGAFGDVTGEVAGSAAFVVEEGSVRGLGFRDRITSSLAFIIRALAIVIMIHYLWLSCRSSLYTRVVSKNTFPTFSETSPTRRTGRL